MVETYIVDDDRGCIVITVDKEDYDALAARVAEAERLLRQGFSYVLRAHQSKAWLDAVDAFLITADNGSANSGLSPNMGVTAPNLGLQSSPDGLWDRPRRYDDPALGIGKPIDAPGHYCMLCPHDAADSAPDVREAGLRAYSAANALSAYDEAVIRKFLGLPDPVIPPNTHIIESDGTTHLWVPPLTDEEMRALRKGANPASLGMGGHYVRTYYDEKLNQWMREHR